MYAQMSTVQGAELRKATQSGYFVLPGIIYLNALGDLPAFKSMADATVMFRGLSLPGLPQEGDKLTTALHDWICMDRSIRPFNAIQWQVFCIFRWTGALQIKDHTSLQESTSVLNPKTMKPVYNKWTDPNPATGSPPRTIIKLCHFRDFLPLRNLTYTKTVPFEASADVGSSRACLNDQFWQGYDIGFWMVSDVYGESLDNGITYTYSVTFTTNELYPWSSLQELEDDTGQPVYVDPVKYKALLAKPYVYGYQDPDDTGINGPTTATCPGLTRCDRFFTINYPSVFGIDP